MKKQFSAILILFTMLVLLSACSTQSNLVDIEWQLTSMAGKTPLAETNVTLNLSKDTIGGNDGCNSYGGSYTSAKDTITFGDDIFSTMMYCTDEIAVQYQAFYEALKQAATYKISNNSLTLIDSKGSILAEFTASQN